MMYCQLRIAVTDTSQVGEVRRQANRIAAEAGMDETDCGKVAIVASELATNLARYAQDSEILLRSMGDADTRGVELIAIDRGPGMSSVAQCLSDGFSTGGTAGQGLGAVQRISSEFDIFSMHPGGTIVLARVQDSKKVPVANKTFAWGAVNRPAPVEEVSGDTFRIVERGSEMVLMIADGLGHGPLAAEAADAAAATFEENPFLSMNDYFATANRRMRGTRGAAIAVAHIDAQKAALEYTGVGNIAGSLRSRLELNGKGLISNNGTVGAEMRKVESFDYNCPEQSLLVMHSDGLQSRWSLEAYPGLAHRHPAIVAAILYRDFRRGRDDVTVVAVQFTCLPKEKTLVA
jgi:anti-sigma regulatory factor (Ser/Thr protein kinase)